MAITKATASSVAPAAKGDLVVGSGTNDAAVLAVGTNGYTLVADSAETTGLKWQAPASSSPSYTLLNSGGTALTGAATITVSGISGKNDLYIYVDSASSANAGSYIKVRVNGSTSSSDYYYLSAYKSPPSQSGNWYGMDQYNEDAGYLRLPTDVSTGTGTIIVHISGCNGSGLKPFNTISWGYENGDTNSQSHISQGAYLNSAAVTSIAVTSSTGNFDAGTLYVYGA